MFHSLQSRLAIALCAAVVIFSTATGVFTYHKLASKLVRRFDDAIVTKAQGVAGLVVQDRDGHLEFDFSDTLMSEYKPSRHAEYFEIRYADGRSFARSPSLANNHLPLTNSSDPPIDVRLPTGRLGRVVSVAFAPPLEKDDDNDTKNNLSLPAPVHMVAMVARDRADLDDGLNDILRAIAAGCIGLALVTAIAVILIVRRALSPLRDIALQASQIDVTQLDRRLPFEGLPAELKPISGRFNDLLDRLQSAFVRERRFTADVAHELRTPIAELRMLAELPLRWPDDHQIAGQSLRDVLILSKQMEQLVVVLLALARAEISGVALRKERVELAPLFATLLQTIPEHRPIEVQIPQCAIVTTDRTLIGSVLNNLLKNAFEYATGDEPIRCFAERMNERWMLHIENAAAHLSEEMIVHLFEPFWRADRARTTGDHTGLGLSLAASYCKLLGIDLAAALPSPGRLRLTLIFAPTDPSTAAQTNAVAAAV